MLVVTTCKIDVNYIVYNLLPKRTFLLFLIYKSANARTVIFTVHLVCSTLIVHQAFFFFAGFVHACLSFPLNIYYLHMHIQLYWLNKFLQYFHNMHCSLKYLYMHTQLHWHNIFLQYFHNYWCANFLKVRIK